MSTATETVVDARFEVGAEAELEVHNVAGRVVVRPHDENAITMRAVLRGSDSAIENTIIERERVGDHVVIRTRQRQEGGLSGLIRKNSLAAVDYDLHVPRGCALHINTVSAGVNVRDTGGSVHVHAVSGGVELADARGSIELHTVSGDISASDLEGTLDAHSTSGHVTVRTARLDSFTLHTVSGSMTIATLLTAGGRYSVSTVSGSLRLTVPPGTGAQVSLSTVSGRVESPGEIRSSGGPGHRSWNGRVGDGGAHLSMNSVSGSLHLLTSESA